jgi:hypothetical protein
MALGVLGSVAARSLISHYNQMQPVQTAVYNGVDMAVSCLVNNFFRHGPAGIGGALLASRVAGFLAGAVATVVIGKPVNLWVAAGLNVSSVVVGLILNMATSKKQDPTVALV